MPRKRLLFLALLLPVVGLMWAMKSAASWRPQVFGVQQNVAQLEFSPDGKTLLTLDEKSNGYGWDVNARHPRFKVSGLNEAAFSSDSTIFVDADTGKADSILRFDVLKTNSGKLIKLLRHPSRWQIGLSSSVWDDIFDYKMSLDGRDLLVACRFGIIVFDMKSGTVKSDRKWKPPARRDFVEISDGEISPDRKTFIGFSDATGEQLLFNIQTDQQIRNFGKVTNVLFSPDQFGFWMNDTSDSSGSSFLCFRARDMKKMWLASSLPIFSSDGELAYIRNKTNLQVLDAHTGRKLRTLPGPLSDNFAPSPDGNWLYEARDGKIWKWRAR